MKIYVAHSQASDFEHELYQPLRESGFGKQHELVFPHENGKPAEHSKAVIATCDLVVAEVSYPSTGVGIEIGWADAAGKPVIAVYQQEFRPSASIGLVAKKVVAYADPFELGELLEKALQELQG